MGSPQRTTTHRSLQRAVAILGAFTRLEPELSVTEISRRVGLHKSTVSRILATLQDEGLVWQNPSGRYSLGLTLIGLADTALGQCGVSAPMLSRLHALAAELDEWVSLCVRRGDAIVVVACAAGSRSRRRLIWPGRCAPLVTTAAGKALLAATIGTGTEDESLLAGGNDGADADVVADLHRIAEAGYATAFDEWADGTAALAAAINPTAASPAAVSIHAPVLRFGPDERRRAVEPLLRTAAALGNDLRRGKPLSVDVLGR